MAVLGRSQPNTPIILSGSAAPVAGAQGYIVTAAPDRRFYRISPAIVGQGVGPPVPSVTVVTVSPDRRFYRTMRPVVAFPPVPQSPVVPGSPTLGPYVLAGPNPRRTVGAPIIVSRARGVTPPPTPVTPADVDWCPQTPVTGWLAGTPFTDWAADPAATNWTITEPVEDC